MSKSFLVTPGYRLNPAAFSASVNRLSSLIPMHSEQNQQLKKRFLSLCKVDTTSPFQPWLFFVFFMTRENESYPFPSKRESTLVLAYTRFILTMDGRFGRGVAVIPRVNSEFFTVIYRAVSKIPFYITTGIQKADYLILSEYVKVSLVNPFNSSPLSASRERFAADRRRSSPSLRPS